MSLTAGLSREECISFSKIDLATFAEYTIHDVDYVPDFHAEWYNMLQNEETRNGVIIAPRNSAKSTVTAKIFPLWLLGCNPDLRILLVGRTSSIAETDLRFIKSQIESNDKVAEVFPFKEVNGVVSGLKQSAPWGRSQITVANNRHDGTPSVYAAGLGGSISGFRADVIIVDDLIDHNNVMTEGQREKVDEFWKSIVIPTLNPGGRIFLVGTRYNNRDFYANILEDPLYKDNVHMFPALKLEDGKIVMVPRLDEDGKQMIDEEGEPMVEPISYWPERHSPQDLMWLKENMGSLAFTSQMLCDPSGYAGQLFDPEHIHYYDPESLMSIWGNLEFVMTVDPNVTDSPDSDNMAVVTAAVDRKHSNVYILDMYAKPHDFVGQLKILKEYGGRRQVRVGDKLFDPEIKISKIGVEAIAFQSSLQQSGYLMGFPIVEIKGGNMNKEIRILRLQPHIENGRIMFPKSTKENPIKWWDDFYEEYCTFPRGRRDDRLDALEMLVDMMGTVFGQSSIPWGPTSDSSSNRVWSPHGGRRYVFG